MTAKDTGKSLNLQLHEIRYDLLDGTEFKLTMDEVKRYLVQGKAELVEVKEFVWFMQKCKALQMNPYLGDCWLIKYSSTQNAAIVVSIDYKRKLAKRQPDCRGWSKGIVVQDVKEDIAYRKGIVLPGDTLLGGWFKGRPANWEMDYELEVSLAGAIKKTNQGELTSFWQKDKQADMVAKVAESRGLTALWGEDLQGLVIQGEVETVNIDMKRITEGGDGAPPAYEIKDAPAEEKPDPQKASLSTKAGTGGGDTQASPSGPTSKVGGRGDPVVCPRCEQSVYADELESHPYAGSRCEPFAGGPRKGGESTSSESKSKDKGKKEGASSGDEKVAPPFNLESTTGYATWELYFKYANGKKPSTYAKWCETEIADGVWKHMPANFVAALLKKYKRFYGKDLAAWTSPVDPTEAQGPGPGDDLNLKRTFDEKDENLSEVVPIFLNQVKENEEQVRYAMTHDVKDPESGEVYKACRDPQTGEEYDDLIMAFHVLTRLKEAGGEEDPLKF